MGVPGLWDLLQPTKQRLDISIDAVNNNNNNNNTVSLRGKVLAVDLAFWVCEAAGSKLGVGVGGQFGAEHALVPKPHLRNLFFKTNKLLTKYGALPVCVVDGEAPALKAKVRIDRYCRSAGVACEADNKNDGSNDQGRMFARNPTWLLWMQECTQLLRLMGLPVLRARHEAEALCAQLCLHDEGRAVHAAVTPDADALLYGARRVYKNVDMNIRDPWVEAYEAADIERRLGLAREHLVGMALLLGCDFDGNVGVRRVGPRHAARALAHLPAHAVLPKLREWGRGQAGAAPASALVDIDVDAATARRHPLKPQVCGMRGVRNGLQPRLHGQTRDGVQLPVQVAVKRKAEKREGAWWGRMLACMAATPGFPNETIVKTYMSAESHHDGPLPPLSWLPPSVPLLLSFLQSHLRWDLPRAARHALPLASRWALEHRGEEKEDDIVIRMGEGWEARAREIKRVKRTAGREWYLVVWEVTGKVPLEMLAARPEVAVSESVNGLVGAGKRADADDGDEGENAGDHEDEGEGGNACELTTEEDMELVKKAWPGLVAEFERKQEEKAAKRKKRPRVSENTTKKRKLSFASSTAGEDPRQGKLSQFFRQTKPNISRLSDCTEATVSSLQQSNNAAYSTAKPVMMGDRKDISYSPISEEPESPQMEGGEDDIAVVVTEAAKQDQVEAVSAREASIAHAEAVQVVEVLSDSEGDVVLVSQQQAGSCVASHRRVMDVEKEQTETDTHMASSCAQQQQQQDTSYHIDLVTPPRAVTGRGPKRRRGSEQSVNNALTLEALWKKQ
eukprot:jgi/Chlat1/4359/Chrsp29S04609